MVNALSRTKLQDGFVSYPWERRMQELLSVPNSSNFLSILLLPKASDIEASRYNDVEDTLSRANAWLNAAQASGVPIVFMNIQTESLLTKVSSLQFVGRPKVKVKALVAYVALTLLKTCLAFDICMCQTPTPIRVRHQHRDFSYFCVLKLLLMFTCLCQCLCLCQCFIVSSLTVVACYPIMALSLL